MQCKQIKKNGEQCKNHGAYGCKTCRYHGARRIKYGKEAPNYKNGDYTKSVFETRRRIRMLTFIGNKLGFLKRKLRGRIILIQGEKI